MTSITFVEADGAEHAIDVADGLSLMEGAVNHGVPGVVAQCGGACACATCHIYVRDPWRAVLPARSEAEAAMLEFAVSVRSNSRLACQIPVTAAMDGMVVHLPRSQG